MTKQSSIKYISGLLDNPGTIADEDQLAVASLRQAFPYFVPVRYIEALGAHKKERYSGAMLSAVKPYMGDWIMFSDLLQRSEKTIGKGAKQVREDVVKREAGNKAAEAPAAAALLQPTAATPAIALQNEHTQGPEEEKVTAALPLPEPLVQVETHVELPLPIVIEPALAQADIAVKQGDVADASAYAAAVTEANMPPVEQVMELGKAAEPVTNTETIVPEDEVVPAHTEPGEQTETDITIDAPAQLPEVIPDAAVPAIIVEHIAPEIVTDPFDQLMNEDVAARILDKKRVEVQPVVEAIKPVEAKAAESTAEATQIQPVAADIPHWIVEEETKTMQPDNRTKPEVSEVPPVTANEMPVEAASAGKVPEAVETIPYEDAEMPAPVAAAVAKAQEEKPLIMPVFTEDYFLQQGVKVSAGMPDELAELKAKAAAEEKAKSLMVMMSFSEWLMHFKSATEKQKEEKKDQRALKSMWQKEKLAAAMEEENEEIPENVFEMAVNSITKEDGLASESLAEIYIKQEKYDKAIEMYRKLSLRNPQKNAYFARKIEEVLKEKQS